MSLEEPLLKINTPSTNKSSQYSITGPKVFQQDFHTQDSCSSEENATGSVATTSLVLPLLNGCCSGIAIAFRRGCFPNSPSLHSRQKTREADRAEAQKTSAFSAVQPQIQVTADGRAQAARAAAPAERLPSLLRPAFNKLGER